jgi:acetylornithine deacetylase
MPVPLSSRALLDRLVAFPTVSRDSNLPLIDWVEDYLEGFGISAYRFWNEDRSKAALYAHVGPEIEGGVMLSGHTDVVPVDGQSWSSDPWHVTEREGRLYGRGTCDMKGFDALAIAALVEAQRAGVSRPLQLALSFDEEVGCTGAPPMIDEIVKRLPKAGAVIVGEPSGMQVVTGHKGGTGFKVHVRGYEVHSSLIHKGVSAIMASAPVIDFANRMNAANAEVTPGMVAALFDPPFTTLHVGMIEGGTAHNITAADCRFSFEFRVVPGEDIDEWVAHFLAEVNEAETRMKAVRPETGITLDRYFSIPPLRPEENGVAEALARRLTGDNGTHVVSYGTEAGQFQAAGFSAVVCGPGDIAQAHQADEFIELSEFRAGEVFMQRLVGALA